MDDPQVTYHGLDQVTLVPSEAWEELFRLAKEYADVARQRREARKAMTKDGPTAPAQPVPQPLPRKPYTTER